MDDLSPTCPPRNAPTDVPRPFAESEPTARCKLRLPGHSGQRATSSRVFRRSHPSQHVDLFGASFRHSAIAVHELLLFSPGRLVNLARAPNLLECVTELGVDLLGTIAHDLKPAALLRR